MILILRKDKYILGRICLYFWGIGEKQNCFWGFGERRQTLSGRRGHYLQEDGEINALFSGIKGAQSPWGPNYRPTSETPLKWRFAGGPIPLKWRFAGGPIVAGDWFGLNNILFVIRQVYYSTRISWYRI